MKVDAIGSEIKLSLRFPTGEATKTSELCFHIPSAGEAASIQVDGRQIFAMRINDAFAMRFMIETLIRALEPRRSAT